MSKQVRNSDRLDVIVNMLIEFSRGNFEIQGEVEESEDPLNTVVAGLNMVGEELAHLQQQLRESSDFLKNILSSIDEIIYARTVIRNAPTHSPYALLSGRTMEIVGLSIADLEHDPDKWPRCIHPDDLQKTLEGVNKVLTGYEAVLIYRIYNPVLKQYKWLEDRMVPKMDGAGTVTHLFGSVRDITEQMQTTLELEESNRFISRLISTSDQFFYIVSIDLNSSFDSNFTYISWQIERIQGSTVEEAKKDPLGWYKSIHPDDLEQVKENNRIMFSTLQPVTRTYRIKHTKTGEYVWLEDYVVPVSNEHGRVTELYGSARDITRRKNAELEREKLIKELSNRYNESMQFNYIVSHNLRSPVAHIIGLARLLNMDMSATERATTLAYILEAAESMDDLLKDLNAILSARSTLNEKVEPFLLGDIIRSVCSNLGADIAASGASIRTGADVETCAIVSIKSYIQSALFNLIANAIKYRAANRPPVIEVACWYEDGKSIISISDNGMGIDLEANRERMFGLYSRFHAGREGKGLGLYMTRTQIESLGGSIAVTSTVGKGTTFTITLTTSPHGLA